VARWVIRFVVCVAGVVFVGAVIVAGLSAKDYGTVAFWGTPSHVKYCGRQYHRNSGSVHGTPMHFV